MNQHSDDYITDKPHNHDVICGRGNYVNAHHGNQLFRKLVKAVRAEYVVSSRQEKRAVAKYVVNVIRSLDPPGYFLTPDSTHLDTRTYYDIGDQRAVDKTRQALREGAPDVEQAIKDGTIRVWKRKDLKTFVSDEARKVYEEQFSGCSTSGQNFEPIPINGYEEAVGTVQKPTSADISWSDVLRSNDDQSRQPSNLDYPLRYPAATNYFKKERKVQTSPSGPCDSSPYFEFDDGEEDILRGHWIPDITYTEMGWLAGQRHLPRNEVAMVTFPTVESSARNLLTGNSLPSADLPSKLKIPTDNSKTSTAANKWQLLSTDNASWAENNNMRAHFRNKAFSQLENHNIKNGEKVFMQDFSNSSITESVGCAGMDSFSRSSFVPLSEVSLGWRIRNRAHVAELGQSGELWAKRRDSSLDASEDMWEDNSDKEEVYVIGHVASKHDEPFAAISNAPRESLDPPSILSACSGVSPDVLSLTASIDSSLHLNETSSARTQMKTSICPQPSSCVSLILHQTFLDSFDEFCDESSIDEYFHRVPDGIESNPQVLKTMHGLEPMHVTNVDPGHILTSLRCWKLEPFSVKEVPMGSEDIDSIGTFDQSENDSTDV